MPCNLEGSFLESIRLSRPSTSRRQLKNILYKMNNVLLDGFTKSHVNWESRTHQMVYLIPHKSQNVILRSLVLFFSHVDNFQLFHPLFSIDLFSDCNSDIPVFPLHFSPNPYTSFLFSISFLDISCGNF